MTDVTTPWKLVDLNKKMLYNGLRLISLAFLILIFWVVEQKFLLKKQNQNTFLVDQTDGTVLCFHITGPKVKLFV